MRLDFFLEDEGAASASARSFRLRKADSLAMYSLRFQARPSRDDSLNVASGTEVPNQPGGERADALADLLNATRLLLASVSLVRSGHRAES